MEPRIGQGNNPDPFTLRVKPDLLTVLQHAGLDLLAYDGAACWEAAGPLREAARRVETDPGLRPVLRTLGPQHETGTRLAESLRWVAERCADRLPGVVFRARAWPPGLT